MQNIKKYFDSFFQNAKPSDRQQKSIRLFAGLSLCALLSACSTIQPNYKTVGSLDNLTQLQDLHAQVTKDKKQMTALRSQALQDIAMSIGAQAGLAWRSEHINQLLTKNE